MKIGRHGKKSTKMSILPFRRNRILASKMQHSRWRGQACTIMEGYSGVCTAIETMSEVDITRKSSQLCFVFTDGNCMIIIELIAYLRRAMLGKCFVLFLLISRVTRHDWY
jgi:hypothetical protein